MPLLTGNSSSPWVAVENVVTGGTSVVSVTGGGWSTQVSPGLYAILDGPLPTGAFVFRTLQYVAGPGDTAITNPSGAQSSATFGGLGSTAQPSPSVLTVNTVGTLGTLVLNRITTGTQAPGILVGNNDATSLTPSTGGNIAFETKLGSGAGIQYQIQIGGTQAQVSFADWGALSTSGAGFHRWFEGGTGNGGGFTNQLSQLNNNSSAGALTLWGSASVDSASSWNGSHVAQVGGTLSLGTVNATQVNVGRATQTVALQMGTLTMPNLALTAAGTGAAPTLPANTPTGATGGALKYLPATVGGVATYFMVAQ